MKEMKITTDATHHCWNCKGETARVTHQIRAQGVEVEAVGDQCASCRYITYSSEQIRRYSRALAEAIAARGIETGIQLRLVRKEAGLSAAEFADLVGVDVRKVRQWETVKGPLPLFAARAAADLLIDARAK